MTVLLIRGVTRNSYIRRSDLFLVNSVGFREWVGPIDALARGTLMRRMVASVELTVRFVKLGVVVRLAISRTMFMKVVASSILVRKVLKVPGFLLLKVPAFSLLALLAILLEPISSYSVKLLRVVFRNRTTMHRLVLPFLRCPDS